MKRIRDQADDDVHLGNFGIEGIGIIDVELKEVSRRPTRGAVQFTLMAVAFLIPLARDFALSRVRQATMTLTPEFPRISAVGRVLVSLVYARMKREVKTYTKPAPRSRTDL
jgi:hypothetical protein